MIKSRIRQVLLLGAVIFLAGLLYEVFIRKTGIAIPCVFYYVTGLKCPGCGVTHMCRALMQLDFKEAFNSHPMLFVQLPFLVLILLRNVIAYIKNGTYRMNRLETITLYIFIVLLVGFAVYRNVQARL